MGTNWNAPFGPQDTEWTGHQMSHAPFVSLGTECIGHHSSQALNVFALFGRHQMGCTFWPGTKRPWADTKVHNKPLIFSFQLLTSSFLIFVSFERQLQQWRRSSRTSMENGIIARRESAATCSLDSQLRAFTESQQAFQADWQRRSLVLRWRERVRMRFNLNAIILS